jgi:hypothetical protein
MKKLLVALVVALLFITGAMAVMTRIRDRSDEEALLAERVETRAGDRDHGEQSAELRHRRQARLDEIRRLIHGTE